METESFSSELTASTDVLAVEPEGERMAREGLDTLEQAAEIALSDLATGGRRWTRHHSSPEDLEPFR